MVRNNSGSFCIYYLAFVTAAGEMITQAGCNNRLLRMFVFREE